MCKLPDKIQPKTKEQLKQLINYAFKHDIYDLNFIDTSEITDMSMLFRYSDYNFDVSDWDVSNVTNMWHLFDGCKKLDCDLSDWKVYKVTDMSYMFNNCEQFNCDLSHWNTSKIKNMKCMFKGCNRLTIPNWYK